MERANQHSLVLINTIDGAMAEALEAAVDGCAIRLARSHPGISFMEVARRQRPLVAVLDHVDERIDAVEMEIALLRELRHDVRIIVVSRNPSPRDVCLVERGVFYYAAEPSVSELARVIEAAARRPAGSGAAAATQE